MIDFMHDSDLSSLLFTDVFNLEYAAMVRMEVDATYTFMLRVTTNRNPQS